MTMLRSALSWKNAWRVRIVALGCIVLFLGVGSQVLVNAVAATGNPEMTPISVSAYSQNARMADGNWTHAGACAVSLSQFPLGTIIALYNIDGSFNRQCIVEDTAPAIDYGSLRLAMPGNTAGITTWGVRNLLARAVRIGWGHDGPPIFSTLGTLAFPMHHWKLSPTHFRTKIS
ncbi:MAG TPA: hypothetical protein VGN15_13175 [Ktedonobacteraceae bacterium]|nr:hypothetical protein [Ktedonobacteraceae bacterium]